MAERGVWKEWDGRERSVVRVRWHGNERVEVGIMFREKVLKNLCG
jgi:hypothetical protein